MRRAILSANGSAWRTAVLVVAAVTVLLAPCAHADPAYVYDLANQWSDESNPNGVWSYSSDPGGPITTHWDDWDLPRIHFRSTQPAWAAAQAQGHVPMWARSLGDSLLDWPEDRVGIHGSDGSAGVTWTSPLDGLHGQRLRRRRRLPDAEEEEAHA